MESDRYQIIGPYEEGYEIDKRKFLRIPVKGIESGEEFPDYVMTDWDEFHRLWGFVEGLPAIDCPGCGDEMDIDDDYLCPSCRSAL